MLEALFGNMTMPPNLVYPLQHKPQPEKHTKHNSCIPGILQFFDQQQLLTGRKHRSAPTRKSSAHKLSSVDEDFRFDVPYNWDQVMHTPTWYPEDYSSVGNAKGNSCLEDSPNISFNYSCGNFDTEEALFESKTVPRVSFYKEERQFIWHDEGNNSRNSPSILDSSKSTATFRETPRKSLDSSDLRGAFVPCFAKHQEWASVDKWDAPYFAKHQEWASIVDDWDALSFPLDSRTNFSHLMKSSGPPLPTSLDKQGMSSHPIEFMELSQNSGDGKDHFITALEDMRGSIQSSDKVSSFGSSRDSTPSLELKSNAYRAPSFDDSFMIPDKTNEPSRYSSFDNNEATSLNEKIIEPPRFSLDSRATASPALESRQEIQAYFDGSEMSSRLSNHCNSDIKGSYESYCHAASTPDKKHQTASSQRMPSIIARLMGLENLPESTPQRKPKTMQKKPSKEAKLLQELLQCKPLEISQQQPIVERKENSQDQTWEFGETLQTSQLLARVFDDPVQGRAKSRKLEFQEVSKHRQDNSSLQKPNTTKKDLKINVLSEIKEKVGDFRTICLHNEVEKKLRQLGIQSYEQDLKTLEQILKGMHLKGIFQNPELKKKQDNLKREPYFSSIKRKLLTDSSITKAQCNFYRQIQVTLKPDSFQGKTHFNGSKISSNRCAKSSFSKKNRKQTSVAILKPVSMLLSKTIRPSSLFLIHEIENMPDFHSASVAPYTRHNKESSERNVQVNSRTRNNSKLIPVRLQHPGEMQRQNCSKLKIDHSINEMFSNNSQLSKWNQKSAAARKQKMQSPAGEILRSVAPILKLKTQSTKKAVRSLQSFRSRCDRTSLQKDSKYFNHEFGMGKNEKVKVEVFHHFKLLKPRLELESTNVSVKEHGDIETKVSQTRLDDANCINSINPSLVTQISEGKLYDSNVEEVCEQHAWLCHAGNRIHEIEEYHEFVNILLDQELKKAGSSEIIRDLDSEVQTESIALSAPCFSSTLVEWSAPSRGELNKTQSSCSTDLQQSGAASSVSSVQEENNQGFILDELEADLKYLQELLQSASMDFMAKRWYHHGNHVDVGSLYSRLQEKWEIAIKQRDEQEGSTKLVMVDTAFGNAEYYRKCRQGAMRCRLLLDCINEILGRMLFSDTMFCQEQSDSKKKKRGRTLTKVVWGGMLRIPCLPSDKASHYHIYTILEKILIDELKERDGQPWTVSNKIILNREIEETIVGELLEELVTELMIHNKGDFDKSGFDQ